MIKPEILGIKLKSFEDPIVHALRAYQNISNGAVEFDINTARNLELTPEKPYSARSTAVVTHLGEIASTLYIIAFAPGDGTGDNSLFQAIELEYGQYPDEPRYYPRSKDAVFAETHLTIASSVKESNKDPIMFAGHLDELGVIDDRIQKIGYIGQGPEYFRLTMEGQRREIQPLATLTAGWRGDYLKSNPSGVFVNGIDRFGDPHAIMNPTEDIVQICAFLAIGNIIRDIAIHKTMLDGLKPIELACRYSDKQQSRTKFHTLRKMRSDQ